MTRTKAKKVKKAKVVRAWALVDQRGKLFPRSCSSRRKLLETGDRELVEDSWRDDFWGWGPNRDGKNMLGKLWMEIRAELRAFPTPPKEKP